MTLILKVLRCPDAVYPETKRVSGGEYSMGRAADNDWVLQDPDKLLSRKHCIVAYRNGGWALADVSANGTFLNGSAQPIGNGEIRELQSGDRIRLGNYEIETEIAEEARPVFGGQPASPFSTSPAPGFGSSPLGGFTGSPPGGFTGSPLGGFTGSPPGRDNYSFGADPFAAPPPPPNPFNSPFAEEDPVFGAHAPQISMAQHFDPFAGDDDFLSQPTQSDHLPGINAAFSAPPMVQAPLPTDLDDWDLGFPQTTPATPPPPAAPPRQAAPQAYPQVSPQAYPQPAPPAADPFADDPFGPDPFSARTPAPDPFSARAPAADSFTADPFPALPQPGPQASPQPAAPPVTGFTMPLPRAEAAQPSAMAEPAVPPVAAFTVAAPIAEHAAPPPQYAPPPAPPAPAAAPVPAAPMPAAPSPAAPIAAAPEALLTAFLEGAALTSAKPEDAAGLMRNLGAAIRAAVSGIRQALIARATIKNEFRIEQTMIRARGNNPLKFSADDDDALSALLGLGRRTDMTPAAALTDALRDMRLHELATMVAMQEAVRALAAQLDPEKLRAEAEGGGMALLPAQKKARAFEAYEKLHARITAALADDFDSVFGKTFAIAYEAALRDASAREPK